MIVTVLATLALATAQPAAEPVPTEPVDHEIEVIGNRLRNWRGTWAVSDGVVTCKTRRSTGDREIDDLGCAAMTTCMTPLAPQWQEIERADISRKEMSARLNALLASADVSGCLLSTREKGIAALVAARRSQRS